MADRHSSQMNARADSDDDGGGKAISKKETRLIVAINSSESVLIDSMTNEMLGDGSSFDVLKFVDIFRKYNPHFVQMLSAESSDDSDDEDERPLPKKYFPYLSAFAKSRDVFITAIQTNYKDLYKKDLKEINFSVFKSHPEELFKSYTKLVGREAQSSSASPFPSQLKALQVSNSAGNVAETIPSLGVIDNSLNGMNMNDVSVDTDHGSLMSAQEEELKAIDCESDTPTPTMEDWNGVRERRRSMERAKDRSKLTHCVPDPAPLVVPSMGKTPDVPPQASRASSLVAPAASNAGREVESVMESLALNGREEAKRDERNDAMQINQNTDIEGKVVAHINGLTEIMREVHQDLRFALPPMVERAVRAHLKEERPLTLTEFIGEEYADNALKEFVLHKIKYDSSLNQIVQPEFTAEGDTLVHFIPLNDKGEKECRSEEREEEQIPPTSTPLLSINNVDFSPKLPLHLQNAASDVSMPYNGVLAVGLSYLTQVVESQLEDLRQLDTRHLSLSNECQLEKGRTVVLKSDMGTYCRGVIWENWTRDSDGKGPPVKCLLVDYGDEHYVPIEYIYEFPKWTETIYPALILVAKLQAYPKGATEETKMFDPSVWESIVCRFNEWKEKYLDIHVMSREEDKFVIDLKNEEGESFTEALVKEGLLQKELSRPAPPPSPPSNTFSIPSHDLPPLPESPSESETSRNGVLAPAPSMLLPAHSEVVDSSTSSSASNLTDQTIPPIEVPAFGTVSHDLSLFPRNETVMPPIDGEKDQIKSSETKGGEGWANIVKDSRPTIPTSMHVLSEDGSGLNGVLPSLIGKLEKPERRTFLEMPSSAGIPSLLKIVDQPAELTPLANLLQPRKHGLIQVLDESTN